MKTGVLSPGVVHASTPVQGRTYSSGSGSGSAANFGRGIVLGSGSGTALTG